MTKYGIYPPRFSGSTVLFKDLTLLEIEDDTLTRAYLFNYNGDAAECDIEYLEYRKEAVTEFTSIQQPGNNIIDSTIRTLWTFGTPEEAILQKFLLLDHLRTYFYKKQKEERMYFDSKIPDMYKYISNYKSKYPEIIL